MRLIPYLIALIATPRALFAQSRGDFAGLVGLFNSIIDILIPFVFTLSMLVFLWGVMKAWILKPGDAEEIEKGKKIVVVGIIVFAIMSSIWGILHILRLTLFGTI